jgi:rhamnulokinase
VRLILESLAEGHRRTLGELEGLLGRRLDTLYLVGGGSRNELLCRLTAERCRRRVVAGPAEATALGNILVQARAMGDLAETDIRDVVRASVALRTYEPEDA